MYEVVIVGSGFSGICMGIKLKEMGITDFIILEKAQSLGGTWRENTYPGAECDIPSALYSYSFVAYPDWEYKWSHQPQILSYLNMCAEKFDIKEHIRFDHEVKGATWNEKKGNWITTISDKTTIVSRHLIFATGQLHHLSTPQWSGMQDFSGPVFHSAKWDHSISLKDKHVGVIGNAASAVQFIPEVAKVVKKLTVFQRSANWMLPKQDRLYKSWEKNLVRKLPFLLRIYRLRIWLLGGGLFFMMKGDKSIIRRFYQWRSKKFIERHIKDPELIKKLIPTYRMGAKRILFSDNYYEALAKANVHLTNSDINKWTPDGIRTADQKDHKLDVIICGTGFATQPLLAKLDIRGKGNQSLSDYWVDGPKNYLGMTMAGFPNLFLMYGPNTNLGHNSIIIMSEAQAKYISNCISTLHTQKKTVIEVKEEALENYFQKIQERLKSMIWASIDTSWYQNKNGIQTLNWPGRTLEYIRRTNKVKLQDFILR